MLWLGIGATIGANVAFSAGYGLLGALISAWPPAFGVLSVLPTVIAVFRRVENIAVVVVLTCSPGCLASCACRGLHDAEKG